MRLMSGTEGDAALAVWGEEALEEEFKNQNIPSTIEEAIEEFEKLIGGGGYAAYKVDGSTTEEVIRQFDPTAKEILIHRQLKGG